MEYYKVAVDDIYRKLNTSEEGLKEKEALKRLKHDGSNEYKDYILDFSFYKFLLYKEEAFFKNKDNSCKKTWLFYGFQSFIFNLD